VPSQRKREREREREREKRKKRETERYVYGNEMMIFVRQKYDVYQSRRV
jgi:hypothetical protein